MFGLLTKGIMSLIYRRMNGPVPTAAEIRVRLAARAAAGGSFTKNATVHGILPPAPIAAPSKKLRGQRRWEIDKLLEENDLHPIQEMITLYKIGELDTDQKISLLDKLASYTVPKLKSVEVEGQVDHTFTLNIVKFSGADTSVPAAVAAIDIPGKVA